MPGIWLRGYGLMLAALACLMSSLLPAGNAMAQDGSFLFELWITQERTSTQERSSPAERGRAGRSGSTKSDDEDFRPARSQTRPLPEIVARVQATPPFSDMDYIGVAGFEARSMAYVLRFLDGRQVVVVHVDARTGRVISRMP